MLGTSVACLAQVPADFPQYVVPGHDAPMGTLRALFWHHYQTTRPLAPLWDEWLVNATIWPAREGEQRNASRNRWAATLASRRINEEGYVHTQQHDGPAHAEGWPFPTWMQAGGIGWHFRPLGVAGYEAPIVAPDGWQLVGAESQSVNERGWLVELTQPLATAQSPPFSMEASRAPWLRINWWAEGLEGGSCYVEWTTAEHPEFSPSRRVAFAPANTEGVERGPESRTMIPLYRNAEWRGTITGLRIGFENKQPAKVVIHSIHTASDTRHNVNNLNFVRGCHDYFLWTRDVSFLRDQIGRIRRAMRYVETEFQTREKKCIYTTWPGHEGRSGVRWADGQKSILPGEGVGSNYWDLLPFGGYDALATIYYYDALLDLADLEEIIANNREWDIPNESAYAPSDLRKHAAEVKQEYGKRFWNAKTGRFGTMDLEGKLYDYGFTFLNNEAVCFGIATVPQAESIYRWMAGERIVEGDTSTGADIYHWRFGPRSTTLRNTDYYFWGWSAPEGIAWGDQVQDGGAVLGWTHYDLMMRLNASGPDSAAERLSEIAAWYDDVTAAGGYREYYAADRSRGSLQGGGTAGGLGLDCEFFESVLATQPMLYGFLGFKPTVNGFSIDPQLPADWPALTITNIHLHDYVLTVTANRDGTIDIEGTGPADRELVVESGSKVQLGNVKGVRAKLEQVKHDR